MNELNRANIITLKVENDFLQNSEIPENNKKTHD